MRKVSVIVCRTSLLLLVILLVGCSARPTPPPSPFGGGGWPPGPTKGTRTEVELTVQGRSVSVTNHANQSWWLSPPVVQVWTSNGNIPPYWLEFTPVPEGVRVLQPGERFDVDIPPSTVDQRVSIALYDMPDPTQADIPWFLWADLPAPPM